MSKNLPKQLIQERDNQIYKLRQAGHSPSTIASQLDLTPTQVTQSLSRTLTNVNKMGSDWQGQQALLMELQRLDQMQAALWPETQHRMVTTEDGEQVPVPPDKKSVELVMKIIGMRADLLGLKQNVMTLETPDLAEAVRSSLEGVSQAVTSRDYKAETLEILEMAAEMGIVDPTAIRPVLDAGRDEDIVDAEILDD